MTSVQIAKSSLLGRLEAGEWRPGEKLPSERTLSLSLGLNRMSLRQALLGLENDGVIFRLDRRGWFVSQPRFIYNLSTHIGFHRAAQSQGEATWSDTETFTLAADKERAVEFSVEEGAQLFVFKGWGALNGHRIFTHKVMINGVIAPDYREKLKSGSFTETWKNEYGIEPTIGSLQIKPIRLEGDAQLMLGCTKGAPGLYLKRMKQDEQGNIIQIDREYWRFDSVELMLERDPD